MKKMAKIMGFAIILCMLAILMTVSMCSANIIEEGGVPCKCGTGDAHNMVSWSLDSEGNLKVWQNEKPSGCNAYYQFIIGSDYPQWKDFVSAHKNDIITADISKINKVMYTGDSNYSLFAGMTNLKTVRFASEQQIQRNWGKGIFENCTNLESVVFGTDDFVPGVVDLSGANIQNTFTVYAFKNCQKIEKVILPSQISEIGQEMFSAGNTSALSEVICLGNITNIGSKAFYKCVSLTYLQFENSDFTVAANAFAAWHDWNLKISFKDGGKVLPVGFPVAKDEANGIYGSNNSVKIINEPSVYFGDSELPTGLERSIYHVGYSVRIKDYDGLRSIFVYDNNAKNSNYTLKEYGVVAMTKTNMDKLSVEFKGTDGISFNEETLSFAIERDGKLVSGSKILSNLIDDEKLPGLSDGTYFAISIVNYDGNVKRITSGVYLASYELYEDKDGNQTVIFTDSGTGYFSSDFVAPSYYDVALGMYKAGVLCSKTDAESIVWEDMCTAGAVTLKAGTDYLAEVDTSKDIYTLDMPKDLDGNPFVEEFTLKEVPIVKTKVANNVLDLTEKTGITYTILKDGSSYTLIYKTEEEKSGLSLPAISAYGSNPLNHQFIGKKWYGQLWSDDAPAGYSSVSAMRPQPLMLNETFRTGIKTIVIDNGIVGANNNAFFRLGATDYVVSEDFVTLSGSPFANAEGITTFTSAPYAPKANTVDLSGLVGVGTLNFSSNSAVKATKVIIPSNATAPTSIGSANILFISGNNVYIPTSYNVENGTALAELKSGKYTFNFYDADVYAWVKKVYNSESDTFEEKIIDSEGTEMKLVNERKAGYGTVSAGEIYDSSKNWEIKLYGTLKNSAPIADTTVSLSVGGENITIALDAPLRAELLAATNGNNAGTVQRATTRKNFTYCPSNNVAYVADYISIKCENGNVETSLYTFDESSSYNSGYNVITYTEKALTPSKSISGNLLKSGGKLTNSNGFYMDVVYTSGLPELERIEFEITKALTRENSGVNSIGRNIYITSDGKTAYLCTINSWQQNSYDKGSGAWLLEIKDFDTATPKVERKVRLNTLGNCKDLVEQGLLPEDCHGPNCPGKNLAEMGRACTGVVEQGDYIYAVERYTGAFDIEQRLTNLGAAGNVEKDDGAHGHGVSYLCVIRKSDFKIEKTILLKNDATSVEINPYDGKLYVMEMTRNWSVYDIENEAEPILIHSFSRNGEFGGDDAEKVAAYALGSEYIEYQRATFWTDGNGKNYIAMSGFSGGFTIWDITDVENKIPTRVAHFSITRLNGLTGRHIFDVAASYPYLYVTVGGTINYRFSDGNLPDGIITFNVSDLTKVDIYNSIAGISGIPFEDESSRVNEGDPAPSRIIVVDDVVMVNYSDKGVAFFRIGEDGVPVYDRCESFTGGMPQTMKLNPATGGIVIINGEGEINVPGVYEIKIIK